MIEKELYITPRIGTVIVHRGLFNYEKLYNDTKNFSSLRKYDFTEKSHIEKFKDKGNEINTEFTFERKVEDNMKYYIDTVMLITYAKRVKGYLNARMKINVSAYIDLDYSEKWQNTPLNKFLFFFYNNIVKRQTLYNYHIPKLTKDLNDYIDTIKEAMQFHH